jgi:uncharacterized caspase-like protein
MNLLRQPMATVAVSLLLSFLAAAVTPTESYGQVAQGTEQANLYERFVENLKKRDVAPEYQQLAFRFGKEYLSKYSHDDEYGQFVKKWVTRWEKSDLFKRIVDNQNTNPSLTYQLIKEYLQKYPDTDAETAASLRGWAGNYERAQAGNSGRDGSPGRAATPAPALAADPQAGRYYALVIGINNYRHMAPLKTAADDAREVASVLQGRFGFETQVLIDADRSQIISAINSYRRRLDENDSLLIYYAGHGHNDREADKGYWLPVDARLDDNANWISADDITTNTKVIPARHVLIISDSCYSGTIYRGIEPSLTEPVARDRFIRKMAGGKSRMLMASGGNEPVADGGGGRHSVFANALLRGLGRMEQNIFTGAELFRDYVQESVAGRANQTPEYSPLRNSGHDSGDFVFVRRQ